MPETLTSAWYPVAFLDGWNGTLICDDYKGYETLFKLGARVEAGCAVHGRRKFDELIKHGHSEVAAEAVRRMAVVFEIEQQLQHCDAAERLALRQQMTRPHWDGLHASGCNWSDSGCPTAARSPGPSTTACAVGRP